MIQTTYKEYLVDTIKHNLETYGKRKKNAKKYDSRN